MLYGPAARVASIALLSLLALSASLVSAGAAAAPEIVSRAAWKARPANVDLMQRQVPRSIVIHHTGLRQQPSVSLERKMQRLQSFSLAAGTVESHAKPAWGDVPYHYYVDAFGRIAEGRDVNYAGDSNTKYDLRDRVQVVIEGDFETEEPSAQQLAALWRLVGWLASTHRIPASRISGHNEHTITDCPGRNMKGHLLHLRRGLAGGS